jgi:release factor glutamine methyltransferase
MAGHDASMSETTLGQLQAVGYDARIAQLDRLEWRMLLSHVLRLSRIELITQDQRPVSAKELAQLHSLAARRLQGEPMAYLLGQREFYGLMLQVTPAVLIPRPDTETLLEQALARLQPGYAARVLDMGTGSGALAVALAHTRPQCQVVALDVSEDALQVARANAAQHQVTVEFLHSDWFQALPADVRFDLIMSNPPYIEAHDPHLQQGDLRFEPLAALTDHDDGLSAIRTIAAGAPQYLLPGGWLLLEHGYDQASAVRALLAAQDFINIQTLPDLAGIERVTVWARRAVPMPAAG